MSFFLPKSISVVAASLALSAHLGIAHAQLAGRPFSQDTKNLIETYDIVGVRLGMSEAEASAAVKAHLEGTVDSAGNKIHLKPLDYVVMSPVTHAPVRAGVRFERDTGTPGVGDALRLLVVDGRVWGIWRNDIRGHYAYDQMVGDLTNKYVGAGKLPGLFDKVGGGFGATTGPGTSGVELYQGHCTYPPLSVGTSIRLEPGCSKVFYISYRLLDVAGVRSLGAGSAQLVDLDVGRKFINSLNGIAADKAKDENKRGGSANL